MIAERMGPRSHTALALAAMLLLTGCLTIEENYAFKKDGSGTMEYVIDMSQLAEMMESLSGLSDGKGKKADEPTMDLGAEAAGLKKLSGVKKVKVKKEKDGYVQRLSFRFADLNALNSALNLIMPDSTERPTTFFIWDGNTLVRSNNQHALEMGEGMGAVEQADSSETEGLLKSMQYKYSFSFQEPIGSTAIADGVIKEEPDPMTVKLNTDWSVIMRDPAALDLRITLTR